MTLQEEAKQIVADVGDMLKQAEDIGASMRMWHFYWVNERKLREVKALRIRGEKKHARLDEIILLLKEGKVV